MCLQFSLGLIFGAPPSSIQSTSRATQSRSLTFVTPTRGHFTSAGASGFSSHLSRAKLKSHVVSFFVAFLSWFAFPPLIPDAIKSDLKLTNEQVNNSNIVALVATLIVRFAVGPMVDAFGPRKVMAGLLVFGAVPSGLAGIAHSANTLYIIRFFIGILGGTFVPCQAWISSWFDKNCVGTVNALVGGWGNMGYVTRRLF